MHSRIAGAFMNDRRGRGDARILRLTVEVGGLLCPQLASDASAGSAVLDTVERRE
jgi:hypothetical protein